MHRTTRSDSNASPPGPRGVDEHQDSVRRNRQQLPNRVPAFGLRARSAQLRALVVSALGAGGLPQALDESTDQPRRGPTAPRPPVAAIVPRELLRVPLTA